MPTSTQSSSQSTNLEAERTVIGALLTDPDAIVKVHGELNPDDFYDPILADVYRSIQRLWEEGSAVDFVTTADKLKNHKPLQSAGGSAFLAEITSAVPTSSHIGKYAAIVLERSHRRKLAKLGKRLEALANEETLSAASLLDQSEQEILRLSHHATTRKPVLISEIKASRFDEYAALHEAESPSELLGIRTGYPAIDELISLDPGDLVVLAGRPSMGKTALALNIARNVAFDQDKTVAIVSLEMEKEQMFDRLFGTFADIEPWKLSRGLLTDDEFSTLGKSLDRLDRGRIYLDDDHDARLTTIRTKARRQQMEHGLDLLIIDYLQLIQVTDRVVRDSRTREMSFVSENIKQLARELECPILALSQLSRECERRTDKRPQLSDLRDSGSIEQDADRVMLMYRPSYYFEDDADPGMTEINVAKNRHGPTGLVELHFEQKKITFASRNRT